MAILSMIADGRFFPQKKVARIWAIRSLLIVFLGLCRNIPVISQEQQQPSDSVTAIVNERRITQHKIEHYFDDMITSMMTMNPALRSLSSEETDILHNYAFMTLVFERFYETLIVPYESGITPMDVMTEFNMKYATVPGEVVQEIAPIAQRIESAIEKWVRNPFDGKDIYDGQLKSIMSYEDWVGCKESYMFLKDDNDLKPPYRYLLVLERKGIADAIAWDRLKENVIPRIVVGDLDAQEYYKERYPKVKAWRLWHFYHFDKQFLDDLRGRLNKRDASRDIGLVVSEYRDHVGDDDGGVFDEMITSDARFPYYAKGLAALKQGDYRLVGESEFGSDAPLEQESHRGRSFYHLLYVTNVEYEN